MLAALVVIRHVALASLNSSGNAAAEPRLNHWLALALECASEGDDAPCNLKSWLDRARGDDAGAGRDEAVLNQVDSFQATVRVPAGLMCFLLTNSFQNSCIASFPTGWTPRWTGSPTVRPSSLQTRSPENRPLISIRTVAEFKPLIAWSEDDEVRTRTSRKEEGGSIRPATDKVARTRSWSSRRNRPRSCAPPRSGSMSAAAASPSVAWSSTRFRSGGSTLSGGSTGSDAGNRKRSSRTRRSSLRKWRGHSNRWSRESTDLCFGSRPSSYSKARLQQDYHRARELVRAFPSHAGGSNAT